jgi:signal transduction histidine kinase
MNHTIRYLFSATTLVFLMLYGLAQQPSFKIWIGLIAMALIYLLIIWMPPTWWTRGKYLLVVAPVIAIAAIIYLSRNASIRFPSGLLLVPLVLLLAREQQNLRWFATILAILTMVAICLLGPTSLMLWTFLPVTIALYMSVRAINIYKEAYRLGQQNIEELRQAHQELAQTHAALQEATVDSMRYAALAERTRLARDIHDGLGHHLTSLIVQLQALEIMLSKDPAQAAKAVPDMLGVARKAMDEVHQAVKTWREDENGDGLIALQGLVAQYAAHAPFKISFHQDGSLSSWPDKVSVTLYRILQEALTNIMRHAEATTVQIQVKEQYEQVSLTVLDNGCYTEKTILTPGYGIKGMMERSQVLGGDLEISQEQPHGLRLQVWLPLKLHQAGAFEASPDRRLSYG